MPRGRPSLLCPEIERKILEKIRFGVSPKTAAAYAGVSPRIVYLWLKRGKRTGKDDEPYREFLRSYRQAQAQARLWLEERALGISSGEHPVSLLTPKEALEILSRMYPGDWGTEARQYREFQRRHAEELANTAEPEPDSPQAEEEGTDV